MSSLCPLDKNKAFEKNITVYGVGSNLSYCISCIKKKLVICKICGFFMINGDIILEDIYINEVHPNNCHIFILVDDDILNQFIKSNNYGFFNYKIKKEIIIEI
jgi:hypothetical protein